MRQPRQENERRLKVFLKKLEAEKKKKKK